MYRKNEYVPPEVCSDCGEELDRNKKCSTCRMFDDLDQIGKDNRDGEIIFVVVSIVICILFLLMIVDIVQCCR